MFVFHRKSTSGSGQNNFFVGFGFQRDSEPKCCLSLQKLIQLIVLFLLRVNDISRIFKNTLCWILPLCFALGDYVARRYREDLRQQQRDKEFGILRFFLL